MKTTKLALTLAGLALLGTGCKAKYDEGYKAGQVAGDTDGKVAGEAETAAEVLDARIVDAGVLRAVAVAAAEDQVCQIHRRGAAASRSACRTTSRTTRSTASC